MKTSTPNRPLTAVALFFEGLVLSLFAIAVISGDFDRGGGFFFLLFLVLAAGAVAASWGVAEQYCSHLVTHGALLTGSVLFAFPFVWLVSTSFKYDEEIFLYPPRWIPVIPAEVMQSPYVTTELLADMPPEDAPWDDDRWNVAADALRGELIGQHAARIDALPGARHIDAEPLYDAVLHGVAEYGSRRLPTHSWSDGEISVAQQLAERVDDELLNTVWDAVYRGIELRAPSVLTVERDFMTLPATGAVHVEAWTVAQGTVSLGDADAEALLPSRTMGYDMSGDDYASVEAVFPLPVPFEQFLGINLPMRQDRSWHAWHVEIETDGRRYESTEPLYLEQYRWQEIGFKRAEIDDRDERELGVWPLELSDNQSGALARDDAFRVRLTVERGSRLQAMWRKYTQHYRGAEIATEHWWSYIANSVYLVVLSMIGQVFSCSLVAYAFARLNWPGREAFFALLLATMMLPPQVTMIPVFMIFEKLGWYNTLQALWAPSFLGSAFFIFLLRQFMKSIPNDLEDAAKIDGCSFFGIYWRIILPLVKPALAAVCIFTFMNTWNDFMGPLIYINDQRLYPLALGLFDFKSQHATEFGMLMAASTLMTMPVIALFFAAQRYFIQGVTLTGMKG